MVVMESETSPRPIQFVAQVRHQNRLSFCLFYSITNDESKFHVVKILVNFNSHTTGIKLSVNRFKRMRFKPKVHQEIRLVVNFHWSISHVLLFIIHLRVEQPQLRFLIPCYNPLID